MPSCSHYEDTDPSLHQPAYHISSLLPSVAMTDIISMCHLILTYEQLRLCGAADRLASMNSFYHLLVANTGDVAMSATARKFELHRVKKSSWPLGVRHTLITANICCELIVCQALRSSALEKIQTCAILTSLPSLIRVTSCASLPSLVRLTMCDSLPSLVKVPTYASIL